MSKIKKKLLSAAIGKATEIQIKTPLCVVIPALLEDDDTILYHPLAGMPLIIHTLLSFEQISFVDEIIVILREKQLKHMADLCRVHGITKVSKLICAHEPGMAALSQGIEECRSDTAFIAIHDPLRPFITEKLMKRLLKVARTNGASAPAVPVRDTIKIVENQKIISTPDRASLYTMQSPQVVEINMCKAALVHGIEKQQLHFTSALEDMGLPFALVEGLEENIRVIETHDFSVAELFLAKWEYEEL